MCVLSLLNKYMMKCYRRQTPMTVTSLAPYTTCRRASNKQVSLTGGVEGDDERVVTELIAGDAPVQAVVSFRRVVHVQHRLIPRQMQLSRRDDLITTAVTDRNLIFILADHTHHQQYPQRPPIRPQTYLYYLHILPIRTR